MNLWIALSKLNLPATSGKYRQPKQSNIMSAAYDRISAQLTFFPMGSLSDEGWPLTAIKAFPVDLASLHHVCRSVLRQVSQPACDQTQSTCDICQKLSTLASNIKPAACD
jgi:hypothetical protein